MDLCRWLLFSLKDGLCKLLHFPSWSMCGYDTQCTVSYICGGSGETLGVCVWAIDLWRTERADWSVTYIGHKGYVFYHYMGDLSNPMYLTCIDLVRDVFLRNFYASVLTNIGSNLSFCYQVMHQFAFTLFILIKYL